MKTLLIVLIGYDVLTGLVLVGSMAALATTVRVHGPAAPRHCAECFVLGLTDRPFRAASGLVIQPDASLARAPRLETLIVPGGAGLREGDRAAKVAKWIPSERSRIRRIATVCTGIYGLAPTGLLDGR